MPPRRQIRGPRPSSSRKVRNFSPAPIPSSKAVDTTAGPTESKNKPRLSRKRKRQDISTTAEPMTESTAGKMESPAADRVFAIPELVESILVHVKVTQDRLTSKGVRQLFALRRVDRMFKASIASSKRLRQEMLLEALDPSSNQPLLHQFLIIKEHAPSIFGWHTVNFSHFDRDRMELYASIHEDTIPRYAKKRNIQTGSWREMSALSSRQPFSVKLTIRGEKQLWGYYVASGTLGELVDSVWEAILQV